MFLLVKRDLILFIMPALLAAQGHSPAEKPSKTSEPPPAVVPAAYTIGSGDVLEVNVWKEPEASVSMLVVRPDGKITLPFVKEVDVVDLTPAQLEVQLAQKFSKYINDPQVTVVVKDIRSKKVYLVGGVKREGSLLLAYPMTILQALSESGGVSEYAKKRKIYVLRLSPKGEQRLPFDYQAVIKGEHLEQNIMLQPGDTVVVPQ